MTATQTTDITIRFRPSKTGRGSFQTRTAFGSPDWRADRRCVGLTMAEALAWVAAENGRRAAKGLPHLRVVKKLAE